MVQAVTVTLDVQEQQERTTRIKTMTIEHRRSATYPWIRSHQQIKIEGKVMVGQFNKNKNKTMPLFCFIGWEWDGNKQIF